MLLSYLMKKEMEEKDEDQAEAFKNLVFAQAFASENPELYAKLYPEDFEEHASLEWERPETPDDVVQLMQDLRETGWSGGV